MRISIPIDRWDPERGGAERYLARLARELDARGHEVTVMCLQASAGALAGRAPRIETLVVPRFPRWRRELAFARAAVARHRQSGRELLWQVRHALVADIYQPHGGSLVASRAAQARSLPAWRRALRGLAAGLRPSHHALCRLDRAVFHSRVPPLVLSVSGKVEEDLRRLYPNVRFRFARLPNPVDGEAFHDRDRDACRAALMSRFSIARDARAAVFAAHHFRAKGLARAIRALPLAAGWHLIVAGRGHPGPFARQAARLGVSRRVHFAGATSELRTLLAGAQAFVLPTYYDACSLGVLEALACGTPPVTSRDNGAAELLEHGRNGFVLERPDDPADLAACLHAVALDPGLAAACRARAELLSWDVHVDRLEEIVRQAWPAGGANGATSPLAGSTP